MKRFLLSAVTLFQLILIPAYADFQEGWDAYKVGDYATALKEWKPLADKGNALAQAGLGRLYKTGRGIAQDYKAAIKWYTLAAEQGNAWAQSSLAEMYNDGIGVTQDYDAAFKWYKLAAEQGEAWARGSLAAMYATGDGVIQDFIHAHMWMSISASNGRESAAPYIAKVETMMTGDQIVKAKKLARECVKKNYKDC
jgi:TPR repeat protein